MAEEPRADTDVSVSLPPLVTGQFVPSAKQTEVPFTAIEDANRLVPDAVPKPNHDVDVPAAKAMVVNEPFVANRFVLVTLVPVAFVQARPDKAKGFVTIRLVNDPFVAKRFVEVTEVAVAFVKSIPCKEEDPRTVNVDVTVEEADRKPPYS